ncbi:peptidoglycan editing factor PgeF [Pseudomarimonas arenosa]|uniref:Purine nucleoside phosphorylase n=1 Tax=Pseudomarimonas arenosa TaxID=2774145 RepID=A0AAW3ZCR3_9GAMM|nr:peptidoglycan editing factor PgeF [Pseudomarimonas arenosa]MBD8524175.1 peptidoglycan editing factor PgeF [Pseudomarimonas arenosa]
MSDQNAVPWWLPADWQVPGIRAGTTLRCGLGQSLPPFDRLNLGLNCGDQAQDVVANRRALQLALGLPSEPRWLRQVHGTGVTRIDRVSGSVVPITADAAVTALPGQVLAILSADCMPVLLAADDGREVAAAHAGWRGLAAGVIAGTVAAMQTPAERLQAWLGPAAGPQAYEVDEPVRSAFLGQDPQADLGFRPGRAGHYWLDLYAIARAQLARLGIQQVSGGQHCTISEPQRFFSYRRDTRCGRMASLIWMS